MNKHFQKVILQKTGASDLFLIEVIQSLWGDYGKIIPYDFTIEPMGAGESAPLFIHRFNELMEIKNGN